MSKEKYPLPYKLVEWVKTTDPGKLFRINQARQLEVNGLRLPSVQQCYSLLDADVRGELKSELHECANCLAELGTLTCNALSSVRNADLEIDKLSALHFYTVDSGGAYIWTRSLHYHGVYFWRDEFRLSDFAHLDGLVEAFVGVPFDWLLQYYRLIEVKLSFDGRIWPIVCSNLSIRACYSNYYCIPYLVRPIL